jgi:hypothetical protein
MQTPKVVLVSAPPLSKFKSGGDLGSRTANVQETAEDKQLPPSPVSAITPKDLVNGLFQKTWQEIESACDSETIPNLEFEFEAPLMEGELLILENNKDIVKRWCVIKNDVFTIYQSFKNRRPLMEIKLSGKINIMPANGHRQDILHGFRIFAGPKYVECYSSSAVIAQAWSGHLYPSSSAKTASLDLGQSSNLAFSPESPKTQTLSSPKPEMPSSPKPEIVTPLTSSPTSQMVTPLTSSPTPQIVTPLTSSPTPQVVPIIMHSSPAKLIDPTKVVSPTVDINGLSVIVPARKQSLQSLKVSISYIQKSA